MTTEKRFADTFVENRPREKSGGQTENRFLYQRTWALCHLLGLHEEGGDYMLIMEFHDDVVVLDSSSAPSGADFFQVKTLGNGAWKAEALLDIPKPKKARSRVAAEGGDAPAKSILGKLLDHRRRFGESVRSLNVVSNAKFEIPTAAKPPSNERQRTCVRELSTGAVKRVSAAMTKELGLTEEPSLEHVYLITTGIGLDSHQKCGAGELAEFLERRKPGGRFAVQPLFRALCDELTRRTIPEWQPTSFKELCRVKGISRQDLERFLLSAEVPFDPQEQLAQAKATLHSEGLAYRDLTRLERGWRRYQVQRTDESDTNLHAFRQNVCDVVEHVYWAPGWTSLWELVVAANQEFVRRFGPAAPPFDETYLEGAILLETKVLEARQAQAPGAQSSTEKS